MDPEQKQIDPRRLVPTALQDPAYRSVHRGVRVVAAILGGAVFLLGLWAIFGSHEPSAVPAVWAARSPGPAVDVDATIAPFPTATPFTSLQQSSAVRRAVEKRFPVIGLTPPPEQRSSASAQASDPQTVPRVLTSGEVAASPSRMTIEPPPNSASAQVAATGSSFTSTAGEGGDGHSSFIAHAGSGEIGYDPEDAPCIVRATTVLHLALVTNINSELPGGVVAARVEAPPVNCANGDEAIPVGAVLQGSRDSGSADGEAQLLGVFTRIIFPPSPGHPNGRAYEMGAQQATDDLGATGIPARRNTHAGKAFGNAFNYTILGGLGAALGNIGSHSTTTIGVGGTSGQFAQSPPATKTTFYANAGDRFSVVLNRDLLMEKLR